MARQGAPSCLEQSAGWIPSNAPCAGGTVASLLTNHLVNRLQIKTPKPELAYQNNLVVEFYIMKRGMGFAINVVSPVEALEKYKYTIELSQNIKKQVHWIEKEKALK